MERVSTLKNLPFSPNIGEQVIDTDLVRQSKKFRESAKKIFKEVDKLIEKAGAAFDASERYALYTRAMDRSNEAHLLMAKAKELSDQNKRLRREKAEKQKNFTK